MSYSKLKKKLQEYKYGRYNLAQGKNIILETPLNFAIQGFYDINPEKTGECTDLAEQFHVNNDYNTIRVFGHDPNVFTSDVGDHAFLIMTPDELGYDYWSRQDEERIDILKNKNNIVIDPSLNFVGDYKNSGYEINETLCQKFADNKHFIISKEQPESNSIFYSKETGLVELTAREDYLVLISTGKDLEDINYQVDLKNFKELEKVTKVNEDYRNIVYGLHSSFMSRADYQ